MSDQRINDEGRQPRSEAALSSLNLCDICREMLTEMFRRFYFDSRCTHHSSQEDVLEAAEKRCYICCLLRNKLSEPSFRFPVPEQPEIATSLRFWCERTISPEGDLRFFCYYVGNSNLTEILTLTIRNLSDCAQLATSYPDQSTWSAANIERAKQWLRDHSADDTTPHSINFVPKRLLHVQASKDDLYQVKLCEGSTIPLGVQYLTLSHCWGSLDFMRLKENNVNKFKKSIEYQSLTKTFRDAIRVTCDLGFQYLWIDSFCIIQDSQKDWLSQGSIMGLIYQNAACTISADAAHNGDEGLIWTRDIDTFLPLKLDIRPDIFGGEKDEYCLLIHETWEDAVGNAPLGKRAWVFQERLLSRKIIHFTTRQLFFESKDIFHQMFNCSEQWPSGVPHLFEGIREVRVVHWWNKLIGTTPLEEHWRTWIHLMEEYSRMRLTHNTDRLVALSGIVKEVQRHSGDQYLAGLWKKDLPHQLLWQNSSSQSCPRKQSYAAPTWSWASIGSEISYQFIPDSDYGNQLHVKFVEAQISAKLGKETTGAIKDGLLRLRGPLRQAWLNQGNHKPYQNSFWTIGGSRKRIYFLPDDLCIGRTIETVNTAECRERLYRPFGYIGEMNFNPQSTITVHVPTQSVFLLPILSAFPPNRWRVTDFITVGLTLIPTDKGRGQFQRVGLFFTIHENQLGSILHLPSVIEKCYYEKKDRGRYTISII